MFKARLFLYNLQNFHFQINGMNGLPISAVKSLPTTINLSALTPTSLPGMTTSTPVVAARKTRVEVVTPQRFQQAQGPPTALQAASLISKLNNNNNNSTSPTIQFHKVIQQQQPQQQLQQIQLPTISLPPISTHTSSSTTTTTAASRPNNTILTHKSVGNNKTCNWVFENGEMCGKTFSKSYNLVSHFESSNILQSSYFSKYRFNTLLKVQS